MRVAGWGESRREHAPFPVRGGDISLRTKRLQITELTCNPSILFWRLHPDLNRSLTVLQCNDNNCESAFGQTPEIKQRNQPAIAKREALSHSYFPGPEASDERMPHEDAAQCLSNLTRFGLEPTSSSRTE